MSRTIYELSQAQQEVLDRDYWTSDDDEEAKRQIALEFEQIQGEIKHKLEFLVGLLPESKSMADACREAARIQQKRAQAAERRDERLREFVLSTMQAFGIGAIDGKYGSAAVSSTKVLVVPESLDINSLPEEFVNRRPAELRKRELMAYLKSCEEVPEVLRDCVIWDKPYLRMK